LYDLFSLYRFGCLLSLGSYVKVNMPSLTEGVYIHHISGFFTPGSTFSSERPIQSATGFRIFLTVTSNFSSVPDKVSCDKVIVGISSEVLPIVERQCLLSFPKASIA